MHELIKDLIERIKAGSKISRNPEEDIATLESWLQLEDDGDLWGQIYDTQDSVISLWLMRKQNRDRVEKNIGKAELDFRFLRQSRGLFGVYSFVGFNIFDITLAVCGVFMGTQEFVKEQLVVWVSTLQAFEGSEQLCEEIETYSGYITYEKVFEWYKKVAPFIKKFAEKLLENVEETLLEVQDPERRSELIKSRASYAVALEFLK